MPVANYAVHSRTHFSDWQAVRLFIEARSKKKKKHRQPVDNGVPFDRKRIIGCAEVVILLCSKLSSDTPDKLLSLPVRSRDTSWGAELMKMSGEQTNPAKFGTKRLQVLSGCLRLGLDDF